MDLLPLACGSVAVGVAVGILSGLLGVGGGTVLVPVFRLLYGMPAIAATATSLFTIIPTSLSGVATHVRNKTCVLPLGLAAGIGGAAMSPVGVWLASISPEWAIMVAAAAVIAYSSITMFRKAVALRRKQKRGLTRRPCPSFPRAGGSSASAWRSDWARAPCRATWAWAAASSWCRCSCRFWGRR